MNRVLRSPAGPALAILSLLAAAPRGNGAAAPSMPTIAPAIAVSESPSAGAFPLVAGAMAADVVVDQGEAPVVSIAAGDFAADVERVTGHKPAVRGPDALANPEPHIPVIVGTLGTSRLIDALAAAGKLDASAIKGKWEAFTLAAVSDPAPGVARALVVAGSDRRGTAYGLCTLSESIGVSPWYWWADVPPRHRPALYLTVPPAFHDAPAVKYRGIFINDEDWGLNPWAKQTFDPAFGNIGPKTYQKVFELLLRLRMNYIWPAMHACSTEFAADPENARLADRYGIVAGSSHCEPMLCNNVKWDEKKSGKWDYRLNRDAIHGYWEDSAKTRGGDEAVWTLGIRGIHDRAMEGPKDIPNRIQIVSQVIHDQRALIDQYVTRKWGPVAQCFVPYKEVLPIYDAGLKVPPDVTLVWVDDNFGYIRRLSNPAERKRPGGAGVYYHLSYYGGPHSYTWIDTTAPALIWEEMHKAWANDAGALWVLNVGDLKPGEIGIDYWARLAWNPDAFGPDSQPPFLKAFAKENFGDAAAQPIADLLGEYYRLGTIRKPELMDRAWAMSLPARRAGQLGQDYQDLLDREQKIAAAIPADARDAYTETIGFPARVLGMTGLIFMADRDARQGRAAAANETRIATLRERLQAEVKNFNTQLAGGKWNHIMPGLVTGKDLGKWSSQVRWPWGEKPTDRAATAPRPDRAWRDAASADRQSSSAAARFTAVAGLGPSARAMALEPASLDSSWKAGDPTAPSLAFDFTTKAGRAPAAAPDAVIDFLPTFRIYPGLKLRVAVSVDNQPPTLVEVPGSSGDEDERGEVRANAVQDNSVRAPVALPGLAPGQHTLTIRAVDPGVVIDRVSLP